MHAFIFRHTAYISWNRKIWFLPSVCIHNVLWPYIWHTSHSHSAACNSILDLGSALVVLVGQFGARGAQIETHTHTEIPGIRFYTSARIFGRGIDSFHADMGWIPSGTFRGYSLHHTCPFRLAIQGWQWRTQKCKSHARKSPWLALGGCQSGTQVPSPFPFCSNLARSIGLVFVAPRPHHAEMFHCHAETLDTLWNQRWLPG